MDEFFTRIAVVDDQFEAQILDAILTERKIPYLIKSYYDSAYDGLFQGQKGWGAVFAPASYSTEISEILTELRKEDQG
jgi:hypothetical protein